MLQQIIDRYFLFDEDAEQMETGIYKGMLAGLDDPYTVYYTPEEYSSLTEETSGVYCGIGVLVSKNVQTGAVTRSAFSRVPRQKRRACRKAISSIR